MAVSADALKQQALALGFDSAGITPAKPAPTLDAYLRWIEMGMHGTMRYMARPDRLLRRQDLGVILPGVRSIVVVTLHYHTAAVPDPTLQDPSRGRIAAYAWGEDYHDVMTPRLEQLAQWIHQHDTEPVHRVYVDTGAVLERAHAYSAGLGFTGKNTMLIHPRRGAGFFLGEMLTTTPFDSYDTPGEDSLCGTCTRCMDSCPTHAFAAPYVLDARRCISYLTIEHKGWIDRDLRPLMGNWVYGCDVCQQACPWQRFAAPTHETAFYPANADHAAPLLCDLLTLNETTFAAQFANSSVYRIKRDRMVRNACIAAGNWGNREAVPALAHLLNDKSPLVRGHASWALAQISGADAHTLLESRYARENDPDVRLEIRQNLEITCRQ